MDRKSLIYLTAAAVLLVLFYTLTNYLFPPVHVAQTNAVPSQITATNLAAASNASPAALTAPTLPEEGFRLAPGPEQLLVVTNQDALYTFTSRGGGIKSIELKKYPAIVRCRGKTSAPSPWVTMNSPAPAPILAILSRSNRLEQGSYTLTRTADGVRAEKEGPGGLRVVKDFKLATNYLLQATVRIENSGGQPVTLPDQEWIGGTATPVGDRDESSAMGVQWFDGHRNERVNYAWFANRTLGCFAGTPRTEYEGGQSNVVWAAVDNQFFTLIAMPDQPAPRLVARKLDLPEPTAAEMAQNPRIARKPFGYESAFQYPPAVIGPHQAIQRDFQLYAGPKEYKTLSRLSNNLDLVMNFNGFFGFFAKALLLGMNGLNSLGMSYGFAIIAITVIIKLVFWPLTQASTRSMKRMQLLQPQMKAIQEKYKDDPKKMQMKLMEFMKEHKVSPLGGCLPMLLQIPVFFGFFQMLRAAIELRGASFLWVCDMSQPDTVAYLPGLHFPINPLPLLMGATMLWQSSLTPPSPGVDPVQQKMMRYMPLMMMFFLYNYQSGLTLYWTVQNLLTIAQMKLTRSADPSAGKAGKTNSPAPKGPWPRRRT